MLKAVEADYVDGRGVDASRWVAACDNGGGGAVSGALTCDERPGNSL